MARDGQERRYFGTEVAEIRAKTEGDGHLIEGYAAVFDKLSDDLGGFRERVAKGFFKDVLDQDVRALFNHDSNMVLGRTKSKTLTIEEDSKGLLYEVKLPDTSYARDLRESVERGDISQNSFGFIVDEDHFDQRQDGTVVRTLIKARELIDVSPVTFPAYPDATISQRALDRFNEWKSAPDEAERRQRERERQLRIAEKA